MKLKDNQLLTLKNIKLVSAVLFVLLLAVRLYQSFALTDGATGFFTAENITVPLMFILAVGAVVFVTASCYINKTFPCGDVKKKPPVIYLVAGIFFSFVLLYDGLKGVKAMLQAGGGFSEMKTAAGGNLGMLSSVFAVLSAFAVLASLFIYIKTGSLTGKLSIPMLFPVVWAFAETLGFFSITVSYIKVSQLFLAIFSAAFLMIFLFENARVLTGIGRKSSLWFFFASGIITAGLCLCTGIPSLLISLIAPEKTVSYCPFELYTLAGGLYALASVFTRAEEKETEQITENVTETE